MKPLSFRSICGCAAALLALSSVGAQTVTISFGAGKLYDSSATLLPTGNLVLLVADTSENGFGSFSAGSTLTAGAFLNGDDQILGRAFSDEDSEAAGTFALIPLASNPSPGLFATLTSGDPLAIVWFSTLTNSSTTLSAGNTYGLFSSESATIDGPFAWIVPSSGSTISINFETLAVSGGTHSEAEGYAIHTISAIPEPTTYAALLGFFAFGIAAWRRRPA